MKSVLSSDCCKKKEKPFPKLMVHLDGDIVMFHENRKGCYVYLSGLGCSKGIGYYVNRFVMDNFKDYEGDVCLTNDEES